MSDVRMNQIIVREVKRTHFDRVKVCQSPFDPEVILEVITEKYEAAIALNPEKAREIANALITVADSVEASLPTITPGDLIP